MGMTSVRLKSEVHWRGIGSESQVGVEARSLLRCLPHEAPRADSGREPDSRMRRGSFLPPHVGGFRTLSLFPFD